MKPAIIAENYSMRKRSKVDIFRQVALALGVSGISASLLIIVSIIITRSLDVTGRGEVALAILIPTVLGFLGQLGLPSAVGYWVSVTPSNRKDIIGTARVLTMFMSAALLLVSWWATMVLPIALADKGPALAFSLYIPLSLRASVDRAVLQVDMRANALNVSRVAGPVFYLLGVMFVLALHIQSVAAMVLAQLGSVVCRMILTTILVGSEPQYAFDLGSAKKLLSYGIRAHLGSVQPVETLRLDQMILGFFLSAHALGTYVVAMTFVTANRLIGTSFGLIAFPVAAQETQRNQSKAVLSGLITGACTLAVTAVAIQIIFGRKLLDLLFGLQTDEQYHVLVILLLGSIFMVVRQVLSDLVRGLGLPWVPTISELASAFTLVGLAMLLWSHSLIGVAWAVTLSAAISLFVLLATWRYVAYSQQNEHALRSEPMVERGVL